MHKMANKPTNNVCAVKNILNLFLFPNYQEVSDPFIYSDCEMMRLKKRRIKLKSNFQRSFNQRGFKE